MDELKLQQLLRTATQLQAAIDLFNQQLSQLQQPPKPRPFLTVSSAIEQMGIEIESSKLLRDIEEGWLEYGLHYINVADPNKRACYRYNPESLIAFYTTPAELRQKPQQQRLAG